MALEIHQIDPSFNKPAAGKMSDKADKKREERRARKDRRDEERRLDERRKFGIGEIAPERREGPRRKSERRESPRRRE